MTTQPKKIEALLERIQKEFPTGCTGLDCKDCPLDGKIGNLETRLCGILMSM